MIAAVLAAVGVAVGVGAYAQFTDAGRASGTVQAGSVDLDWAATPASSLALQIGPLVPGGTVQRLVDLRNIGSVSVAELQLATTGTEGIPATDFSDGIQMRLERCSIPWEGSPGNTTCGGQVTEVIADRPVTGRNTINGASSTAIGGTDHLRFTFRLPESVPYSAADTTGTITFTVLGNQRPGQQR